MNIKAEGLQVLAETHGQIRLLANSAPSPQQELIVIKHLKLLISKFEVPGDLGNVTDDIHDKNICLAVVGCVNILVKYTSKKVADDEISSINSTFHITVAKFQMWAMQEFAKYPHSTEMHTAVCPSTA